ncbi:MAG: SDR family NAD(P)-dependent oxidoreductase [Gammaproteobacteria bacterium]|nr:SDR family NAD(P)-dependent oxidoreductase [Gammaproteobacteria bacterium]HXK56741.1 SDR family NAD(P)-dependent oxidoreductase [Gammaproteobacteria bacterium]
MTEAAVAGQFVVLSGATSDIGKALARSLASAGARLCLLGRNPSTLQQLADDVGHLAAGVTVCPVDLTDDAAIATAVTQMRRETGAVDVLVHGAGAFEMGPLQSADVSRFDLLYRTNVRGPYLLTQSLLPLIRSSPGQIVFLNSTVGLEAKKSASQYAATQHALRAMADALRAEVNADGVRVLSVYLGRTATARQERIFRLEGRPYAPALLQQPEDVAQMVLAALHLPRTAEVTEIRMRPMVKSY